MSREILHRRTGRRRGGIAIVEFALGAGVLMAAFSGTFEIGYTLVEYSKLEAAVAQGAEYASIVPYDSGTATPSAAYLSAVQNMVLSGNPAGGNATSVSGLAAQNISVTVAFANGVPGSVTVAVTGYKINAVFGSFTLTNKPRATYPYRGLWSPA